MAQTWPQILQAARAAEGWILFGDEVSFAQWGSLGYTWARRGQQPVVMTSGKRRAYKVFGLIEFFSGQFFYHGITDKFNSQSYIAFLSQVLEQTSAPLFLIQDGARYHTSTVTRQFFAAHADRLSVFQLPSYSPDYNPIEFSWRNVKRDATHLKYFPTFDALVSSVDHTLTVFSLRLSRSKLFLAVISTSWPRLCLLPLSSIRFLKCYSYNVSYRNTDFDPKQRHYAVYCQRRYTCLRRVFQVKGADRE